MLKTLKNLVSSLKEYKLWDKCVHVFDLDDTLLMTRDLVKAAYIKAGVSEDRFEKNWGNAASMWVTSEEAALKSDAYGQILFERFQGDQIHTVMTLLANHPEIITKTYTLTSASYDAYRYLQRFVGHLPPLLEAGCQLHRKIEVLRDVQKSFDQPVIYYDDDRQNIETIRQSFHNNPGFKGVLCHFGREMTFTDVSTERMRTWTV